ncbi:MAG: UDP-N-acetylmuramoyl-L-alanyl-D-glutamate--2,6-diaminopimelate ligase [Oscillospiraceae bacterium]|nr:UDP-N-acetylmuramoyl-L-alanyl-D-glutamate--2,6-diaminopimelate ligase [Oscillospiraceae bacterium]
MILKDILNGIEGLKAKGDLDIDIKGITHNSREVKEGYLFIARKGFDSDGHMYIKDAVANGAVAIMVEEVAKINKTDVNSDTIIIVTKNTRADLAKVASNFYGNPASALKLIGVTGTKGKTTVTFMVKSILEKQGLKVGLIGTVANYIGDENLGESERTTPDCIELQQLLRRMVEENVEVVVMEVSSQSLKLHRVDTLVFDVGLFTNFSRDHIGPTEHPTMEDYFDSKLKLFNMSKVGYINTDDFRVAKVKNIEVAAEIKSYGIDNAADLIAKDITVTNVSADFKIKIGPRNERVKVGIPGRFSVYNSLAAICASMHFGAEAEAIKEGLVNVTVPGRSELVPNKKDLCIMVDYAHSPDSLESILKAVKGYTKGRVITVFGCGGDRDAAKRPIMGEISGLISDFTIITSDNPRTEKPEAIVQEIEEGIKKTKGEYVMIANRTEAIKHAIEMANKNDIILLAGKGHETYQEIDGIKHPYDEREIIQKLMG